MIILIGNQKGGAGKSTLTLVLANYLTMFRHCKVTVIDMDYQQSIVQKYQRAKLLENADPYEVIAASLEQYPALLKVGISSKLATRSAFKLTPHFAAN